jgi:hypothetical protein
MPELVYDSGNAIQEIQVWLGRALDDDALA